MIRNYKGGRKLMESVQEFKSVLGKVRSLTNEDRRDLNNSSISGELVLKAKLAPSLAKSWLEELLPQGVMKSSEFRRTLDNFEEEEYVSMYVVGISDPFEEDSEYQYTEVKFMTSLVDYISLEYEKPFEYVSSIIKAQTNRSSLRKNLVSYEAV